MGWLCDAKFNIRFVQLRGQIRRGRGGDTNRAETDLVGASASSTLSR